MPLTVPQPSLTQAGAAGPVFTGAKPIEISCGPVTFPDGTPVELSDRLVRFGYRLLSNGDAWDPQAKTWVSISAEPELEKLFLEDGVWKGMLVAIGQQDEATQSERIATDPSSHTPQYAVQCVFAARDAAGQEHEGTSPASEPVEVIAAIGNERASVKMNAETPADATEATLYAGGKAAPVATVTVSEDGPFRVQLRAGGGTVTLSASGAIGLAPGPGQKVTVAGDLIVNGDVTANSYV